MKYPGINYHSKTWTLDKWINEYALKEPPDAFDFLRFYKRCLSCYLGSMDMLFSSANYTSVAGIFAMICEKAGDKVRDEIMYMILTEIQKSSVDDEVLERLESRNLKDIDIYSIIERHKSSPSHDKWRNMLYVDPKTLFHKSLFKNIKKTVSAEAFISESPDKIFDTILAINTAVGSVLVEGFMGKASTLAKSFLERLSTREMLLDVYLKLIRFENFQSRYSTSEVIALFTFVVRMDALACINEDILDDDHIEKMASLYGKLKIDKRWTAERGKYNYKPAMDNAETLWRDKGCKVLHNKMAENLFDKSAHRNVGALREALAPIARKYGKVRGEKIENSNKA